MADEFHPGQIAEQSGQYLIIGPDGIKDGEVTVVKGEPFPPTPQSGATYILADATKHTCTHEAGRLSRIFKFFRRKG